ncbi:Uncharacterised protein [Chlamydia trachomatis]|nr:Uncharacterised protein [Chlamydia trachomatis]
MIHPFLYMNKELSQHVQGDVTELFVGLVSLMLPVLYIFHFSVWAMAVITDFADMVI